MVGVAVALVSLDGDHPRPEAEHVLLNVLPETILELGPIEVGREDVNGLVGDAGQILLIVVVTMVVVRVANRLVDQAVERVKDPNAGRLNALWSRGDATSNRGVVDEIAHGRKVRRADAMSSVARSIVAAVMWTLAVLAILATVGVNLGPYIAGLGIVGVALGFGAQDLVADFVSGIFMLLEDQYGIGDIVDAGEATGVVEGITLRTTRIRSVDGTLWYVPNGEIRRLGNMSQGWARALLDIGVAYDTDVDHAAAVIERVATGLAEEDEFAGYFLAEPEVWGVERLGADSIDIRLVIRTTPGDQWAIGRELRRRLKHAFDDEGIEIPFPQRTLWIRDQMGEPFPGTSEGHESQPDADAATDDRDDPPGAAVGSGGGAAAKGDEAIRAEDRRPG